MCAAVEQTYNVNLGKGYILEDKGGNMYVSTQNMEYRKLFSWRVSAQLPLQVDRSFSIAPVVLYVLHCSGLPLITAKRPGKKADINFLVCVVNKGAYKGAYN